MAADPSSDLRRSVYLLLIAVAVAVAAAKVVGAENVIEPSRYKSPTKDGYGYEEKREWPRERPDPTPMFSSNDKSRWATVRALIDNGTFVIGKRVYDPYDPKKYTDEGIVSEGQYRSLDIVMNPETKEFYSSKPPLFTMLIAGEYWALKKAFGWSIVKDRWLVMPTIILTVNVLPFLVYLVLISRLIETVGKTDFGKLLAFITACVGTFLTTFAGTLNNHLPAAFCVLFASYPIMRAVAENRDLGPGEHLCCGFFAGLAATLELPAAAFLAGVGVPLLIARPKRTVLFFLPAAALPIAALFVSNYAAMGRWTPAYGEFGGPWYNFEGSHWARLQLPERPKGIDFANETKDIYAFHLLFGHHGWFSLTPVFFIALAGLVILAARSPADIGKITSRGNGCPWSLPLFAAMTLAVSVVVVGFYVMKTNNYGGNTSGPRWLFWLIPLWLLSIPTASDYLAKSWAGRGLAAVLLGFSVLAVFYPAWNPWRPPWVLQCMEFTDWLRY